MAIEFEIIQDLAIIMIIAAGVAILFYKLRQPIFVAYLVAGIIIGPYTPPFSWVLHLEILPIFAQLGIILLLFSIGLEFPISKLRKMSKVALGIALIEMPLVFFVIFILIRLFQWSFFDSLFLAAALSISSTVIAIKIFEDLNILSQESSILTLGVLIVEDIVAVVWIAMLQNIASLGAISFYSTIFILGKVGLLIGGVLIIGTLTVPKAIDKIRSFNRQELTLITILGLCFGIAIFSYLMGFSVAIGAFLAGVLVAESKSREFIATLSVSLKEMFAAIFFVTMGALMSFTQIPLLLGAALIISLTFITMKLGSIIIALKIFRYRTITAIRTGLGMTQIGEFSFIIVALGINLNIISPSILSIIGIASIITSFVAPYLVRVGMKLTTKDTNDMSHF